MSTKTSIKRIALVAVAALGFGMVSTVAANAAEAASVTLDASSATRTNVRTWTVGYTMSITGATANACTATAGDYTVAAAAASGLAAVSPATGTVGFSVASAALVGTTGATLTGTITVTSATDATAANVAAAAGTYTGKMKVTGPTNCTSATVTDANAVTFTIGSATTGSFIAGTYAAGSTSSAALQAVNGQATLNFIQGSSDTSYTITSTGVGSIISATPYVHAGTAGTAAVNLNGTSTAGGISWTPASAIQKLSILATSSVAGIQTINIQPIGANGAPGIAIKATITWGGTVTFSPATTIVRQGSAVTANVVAGDAQGSTSATAFGYTTTLDAIPHSAYKTAGTALGVIQVVTLNSDGSAAYQGNTVSASIAGSGLVWVNTTAPTAATAVNAMSTNGKRADYVTFTSSQNVAWIYVYADGTAGKGTVTVSVTDAVTGVTTVVGTEEFTSYGTAATLSATVNASILRAGYKTGFDGSARTKAGNLINPFTTTGTDTTTVPAVVIVAKDSNGSPVTLSNSLTVKSSDASVLTGGTCTLDAGGLYGSALNGVGYYNCSLTAAPNAVSGAKATATFRSLNPLDTTGTTYISVDVPVSIGGKVATTSLKLDSASYEPGQQMLATFTAVDSSGNPVYDGAASPGDVTGNKALGGAAGFTGWFIGGVDASAASLAESGLYAPAIDGSFTVNATGTDAAATALSASATVSGTNGSGAAIDAANEATDAANAATDAANAAAEAADAATAAAQDAQAAVAALATSVSTLIAGIKAQITTLTNLVIKIQKKVRA